MPLSRPLLYVLQPQGVKTGNSVRLKIVANISCYLALNSHCLESLFDSLSLSRYGESSGELSSVVILNPMTGNSLEKAISQDS